MSSGKCAKFSGLIASISIKRKPCNLCLNRRAIFCKSFNWIWKVCCISGFVHCVFLSVDTTREKNIVLVVSLPINLIKTKAAV